MEKRKYEGMNILPPGHTDIESYIEFLLKIFKIRYEKDKRRIIME
jgi:hypothetical protein